MFSLIPASSQTGREEDPRKFTDVSHFNIPHHSLPWPDHRERDPLTYCRRPDQQPKWTPASRCKTVATWLEDH
ncbi:hypothetical protein PGT21_013723 [Puccinia graminis f. sp. tritici]|uniref:Uncharacterized protein n=1 Tax=Puccinia graminis f. sp. tritici TaxID=56615 RepID=A0A5B0Q5W5_PUCGR|nr:hypothetical protein PGT21_013723 [Puccinia graminis f. sp. tritici]KAA1138584.1 hypothetical protein PGTUg99_030080 [Puccinia graminis f. sp. tritici]